MNEDGLLVDCGRRYRSRSSVFELQLTGRFGKFISATETMG
jgi:hypothetical protein